MKGPVPTYDLSCDRCEFLQKHEYFDYEDGHKEYWTVRQCGHPDLPEAMKTERIYGSVVVGFTTSTPKWCPEIIPKIE